MIFWCTFECEVDYLLAKKENACEKSTTTTRNASLIRQIERYFQKNFENERFKTRQKVWRNVSLMRDKFIKRLIFWKKQTFLTIYQIYWHKFLNEHDEQIIYR